ncbi:MAG: hypothetical protein ABI876_10510 [Bacteroidota bacterium]
MSTVTRYGTAYGGLGGFCWPWEHDLKCSSVANGGLGLTNALTTALKAKSIPNDCANKALDLLRKAADADDWGALAPGEYNWLNSLHHALVRDDWSAPPECLMGATPGTSYIPGSTWTPSADDPGPPSDFPWGWIIAGVGVCGAAAFYWFYLRKQTVTRKKK